MRGKTFVDYNCLLGLIPDHMNLLSLHMRYTGLCLFDSLRPINNLSVKQGRVFLG